MSTEVQPPPSTNDEVNVVDKNADDGEGGTICSCFPNGG